jgi:hypothetical protein
MDKINISYGGKKYTGKSRNEIMAKMTKEGIKIPLSKLNGLINKKPVPQYVLNTNMNSTDYNTVYKLDPRKNNLPLLNSKFDAKLDGRKKFDKLKASTYKVEKLTKTYKKVSKIPKNNVEVDTVVHIQVIFDISGDIQTERNIYIKYKGLIATANVTDEVRNGDVYDDNDEIIKVYDNLNQEYTTVGIRPTVQAGLDDTLTQAVIDRVSEYLIPFGNGVTNIDIKFEVLSIKTNVQYDYSGLELRASKPLMLFNEHLINFVPTQQDNCVREYLQMVFPKISPKKIDMVGKTIQDINDFCVIYNIHFLCYNKSGEIVSSYKPSNKKKCYRNLHIMAYNNHIYGVKNKYLKSEMKDTIKNIIQCEDIKTQLIKCIDNGIEPLDVKMKGKNFISFETEIDIYMNNPEYVTCVEIAKKLGFTDKLPYSTNFLSFGQKLTDLYSHENVETEEGKIINQKRNIKSLWLSSNEFIKGGFTHFDEEQFNNLNLDLDKVINLDKNKCHCYSLRNLPYLIRVNMKYHKLLKNVKQEDIVDHYLYIVSPEQSSIILPDTNSYAGYHLKIAIAEGLKFDIKMGIEADKVENFYKQMIDDLFKIADEKDVKNIINYLVGKMEKGLSSTSTILKFDKIANKDEAELTEGYPVDISDDYQCFFKDEASSINIYTMKPISFQVKDSARLLLYQKMKDLKLTNKQIIKVKTDSITFVETTQQKFIDYKIGKTFNDWKFEDKELVKMDITGRYDNVDLSFKLNIGQEEQILNLVLSDAGSGKTYDIVNNLTHNMTDYTILTPTHATLKDYKQIKKTSNKCEIIQTYSYNRNVPEAQNIIIDEIGMVDSNGWDLIIRCIIKGKNIYCYGDFTQLLPINHKTPFDNNIMIKSIFKSVTFKKGNRRNNFTKEYYDKLREVKPLKQHHINHDYTYQKEQVLKHSTNWKTADYIVCYRRDVVDEYNELKLKYLNLEFDSVESKIICKSNKLRDFKIFNNFIFTIKENDGENITLDDGKIISIKDLNRYFKSAYAVTLHSIQGQTIGSYHYPEEDLGFIDSRTAYTLISRLKEKIKHVKGIMINFD